MFPKYVWKKTILVVVVLNILPLSIYRFQLKTQKLYAYKLLFAVLFNDVIKQILFFKSCIFNFELKNISSYARFGF